MVRKPHFALTLAACLWLTIPLLAGCGIEYAGSGTSPGAADAANQAASPINRMSDRTPPSPNITVQGKSVGIDLTGYTWCPASGDGTCASAAFSIAAIRSTKVPAGSRIRLVAPEGVEAVSLANSIKGFLGDPHVVPSAKGTYVYSVHCKWSFDQGESDYSFALEVV
ncbi:hypothetical protein [Paenibacillus glycinis]|uniref:Lipoprotein n=1 Tax=Paenibacillus glycinis TaxID=2697035 RepID=A0ABW9XKJ1_9BACL|nr:hypothetical protein [Paenibacillus glycinis]NBD23124.1 hypothetical protein [Paenibacillus glycinis]